MLKGLKMQVKSDQKSDYMREKNFIFIFKMIVRLLENVLVTQFEYFDVWNLSLLIDKNTYFLILFK